MKGKEPRKIRTYKIKDSVYNKAKKRADKAGGDHLATLIESWVTHYSAGYDIVFDLPPLLVHH